jgi:hypothetical protein
MNEEIALRKLVNGNVVTEPENLGGLASSNVIGKPTEQNNRLEGESELVRVQVIFKERESFKPKDIYVK